MADGGMVEIRGARSLRPRWAAVSFVVSLLAVGIAWALSSPVGSSPDDDFHLPSIWCAPTAPNDLCRDLGPSSRDGFRRVEVSASLGPDVACYRYQMFESAGCQKLGSTDVIETTANDDLYPGGYYFLMGAFAREGVAQSVVLMRLINFALCAALLVASALLAPARIRRSAAVALVVTSVPMTLFLYSSTNPSGVVIASTSAVWMMLHVLLVPAERRTRAMQVGLLVVAAVLALTSRSDAGVFLVIAAVAVAFSQPRERLKEIASHRVIMILMAASAVFIAMALISRFPDAGIGIGMQKADYDRSLGEVFFYNFINLPLMWTGGLGGQGLGWLDTPIPHIVTFVAVPLVVVAIALGYRDASTGGRRSVAWTLGMLAVVPFYVMAIDRSLVGEIFQARYLLPLLPIAVMCALESTRFSRGEVSLRSASTVAVVALSIAHAAALLANMRRYVTGVEVRVLDLDSNREWWWPWGPSANVVLLIGTVGFAVAAWQITRWLETRGSG